MRTRRLATWLNGLALLTILLAWPRAAAACDVPVFRYALERWRPDVYHAQVLHRGALSAAQQRAVELLTRAPLDPAAAANLQVESFNLNEQEHPGLQSLWEANGKPALPCVILRYPSREGSNSVAWAGPLTERAAEAIISSPARRELARRLVAGDASVWLFLESGDKAKDAAALARLEALLTRGATTPPAAASPTDPAAADAAAPGPASGPVRYSILRVARNDPAELMLVAMLRHSENELADINEPMTFPVFGQGRALYAVVGRGINEQNVGQACDFLSGPCSCEVKEQNPGTDLLMAANWQVQQTMVEDAPPPPLTSLAAAAESALTPTPAAKAAQAAASASPGATALATGAPAVASPTGRGFAMGPLVVVLVAAVLAAVVSSALILRRSSREES